MQTLISYTNSLNSDDQHVKNFINGQWSLTKNVYLSGLRFAGWFLDPLKKEKYIKKNITIISLVWTNMNSLLNNLLRRDLSNRTMSFYFKITKSKERKETNISAFVAWLTNNVNFWRFFPRLDTTIQCNAKLKTIYRLRCACQIQCKREASDTKV